MWEDRLQGPRPTICLEPSLLQPLFISWFYLFQHIRIEHEWWWWYIQSDLGSIYQTDLKSTRSYPGDDLLARILYIKRLSGSLIAPDQGKMFDTDKSTCAISILHLRGSRRSGHGHEIWTGSGDLEGLGGPKGRNNIPVPFVSVFACVQQTSQLAAHCLYSGPIEST
ncbi:hypothetical protein ARMGADRAFT_1035837 [Armillaria gallica]|uniref:Uncharacterized protein n=1 Tax=Armillaria gallica TaxID=47427 RepID=A0A2H3CWB2_ARMGA|nr:hypothetical protein ARMGADRAFT_1035837 [Armillaria gallica]